MTAKGAVPQTNNIRAGIVLMIAATVVFAIQDGISRYLAGAYNTYMVVMVRYWFFAAFVLTLAARSPGGIRAIARTTQPGLQIFRGLLLAFEVCVAVYGFTLLGLIKSQAVFIAYPILIAALSGLVLGEAVGWRRWGAMTAIGVWFWQPMTAPDWGWMGLLSISGVLGHWLLIKCYEMAQASAVQPFAYFHLIWASIIGLTLFGEVIRANVAIGAGIIVAAGLFTLWRERAQG